MNALRVFGLKLFTLLYPALYFWNDFLEGLSFRIRTKIFSYESRDAATDNHVLFSIVIPTYGREKILLERTLPAILKQTVINFECIVVTDGPEEVKVRKIMDLNDPRLRVFSLERRPRYPKEALSRWMVQGYAARNLGLKLAKGDWILWMSDDDVLLANCLEYFYDFLCSNKNLDVVMANFLKESENGWEEINPRNSGNKVQGLQITGVPATIHKRTLRHKWRKFSYLKKWNRPNDYDLYERQIKVGARVGYLDKVVSMIPYADPKRRLHGSRYHLQGENPG
jgi:glycosyltransferase involved in cell wall biosynthesis